MTCIASLAAQGGVVKSVHLPLGNDSFNKWQTEWLEPGTASDSAVWDFSQAIVRSEHHPVLYLSFGDSALVRFEGGTQYSYTISGDSVLWMGYENPTTKAGDSIPPLAMRFPMDYGDSIATPLYFKGDYCGNNALAMRGEYKTIADGRGTLILPDDTVPDVMRLRTEYTVKVKIDRDMDMAPISENDTLMTKTVTAWRWYSSDYRYPLAESIRSVYLDPQGNEAQRHEVSYIFTPDAQEYALENSPRRMLANMQGYGTGDGIGHNGSGHGSMSLVDNVRVTFDADGVHVTVNRMESATGDGGITVVLSDQLGRVWHSVTGHFSDGGQWSGEIATSWIPSGNYVLHISTSGDTVTHKLIIR
jgi:hypothetical protein